MLTAVEVVVETLFVVVVEVWVLVTFFGPAATRTATATPRPSASAATAISAIALRSRRQPSPSPSPPSSSSSRVGGMNGVGGCEPPPSASTRRGSGGGGGSSVEGIADHLDSCLDLVFADHERRQKAEHAGTGNVYHQPAVESAPGDVRGVEPVRERDPHHQAAPANLGDRIHLAELRHE